MAKKSLEERIQRLEDIHEIQNLMSRYEYLHTAGLHEETAELFAKRTPGVRAEVVGWGVYEGTEGIQKMFVGIHKFLVGDNIGIMNVHTLTTPVIELAGDGKTAKGVWISPGVETEKFKGKPQAHWAWAKYAVDFVKEDGKWKFWHFHVYALLHTPYEKSWVETFDELPFPPFPDELKSDRPTTYWWTYSPDAVTENVPAPPEPYETFDEATAY
jgi:hypothetical protein